jgi:hypothetical protein
MSKSKSQNRRLFCFKHHKPVCIVCGENRIGVIEVHHYDKNRKNDKVENYVPLCSTHHAYVHKGYAREIEHLIDNYVKQFCKTNAFIFKQIKCTEDGDLLKKDDKIQNTFGFLFKVKYVIRLLLTDLLFNNREQLKYTVLKLKRVRKECASTRIKLRTMKEQLLEANTKLNIMYDIILQDNKAPVYIDKNYFETELDNDFINQNQTM